MAPRPMRKRWVKSPPKFVNFKPSRVPRRQLEGIVLHIDEYEAIRLADYLDLSQEEAGEHMGISRPTFTRLIEKARYKVARALNEGLELVIEGGNISYLNYRSRCRHCGEEFIKPVEQELKHCPECGSEDLHYETNPTNKKEE